MIREAVSGDAAMLEAYLSQHSATTMFLRSNLAKHGVGWSDTAHSTRYFVFEENGDVVAVFGIARSGFLMAEASGAGRDAFRAFANCLSGQTILGMTGERHSVAGTLSALGLENASYRLFRDEPLLHLDLAMLPAPKLKLRRPGASDRSLLSEWMTHYELDTGLSETEAQAHAQIENRLSVALSSDTTLRLALDDQGRPVAMAGINASVSDVVQVGSVFVPRSLRRRGFGRQVTAALLYEARETGASQALLFAASPAAEQAYLAIGFRPVGTYRLALLTEPYLVGGPS